MRLTIYRIRCCEYALLILEYWADAPEIQRSADLYEDLIKCCVADAMSEVGSFAECIPWLTYFIFVCIESNYSIFNTTAHKKQNKDKDPCIACTLHLFLFIYLFIYIIFFLGGGGVGWTWGILLISVHSLNFLTKTSKLILRNLHNTWAVEFLLRNDHCAQLDCCVTLHWKAKDARENIVGYIANGRPMFCVNIYIFDKQYYTWILIKGGWNCISLCYY